MSILDCFDNIPPEGMALWEVFDDDVDYEIECVVDAIRNTLAEEGIEAKVTYKFVKQYSVPDDVLEKYGIRVEYEPPDAYLETIYKIQVVSGEDKWVFWYIPEYHEMGYFFASLADAKKAAQDEIETLVEWIEYVKGGD